MALSFWVLARMAVAAPTAPTESSAYGGPDDSTDLQAPPGATLDDAMIVRALEAYLARATYPFPIPEASERARLLQGKVLKERLKEPGGDRAIGLVVSDLPLEDLWLGSLDPHFDSVSSVTAHFLPTPPGALTRWYGFVDLPFPFADRHFLITTMLNAEVAKETSNRIWERAWSLDPDGVALMEAPVREGQVKGVDANTFSKAIYTPVNHGSWLFVRLEDTGLTLVGYTCATVVGGDIPDNLVTQHILAGLDELLTTVVARAGTMREHYTGTHDLWADGRGVPIPLAPPSPAAPKVAPQKAAPQKEAPQKEAPQKATPPKVAP